MTKTDTADVEAIADPAVAPAERLVHPEHAPGAWLQLKDIVKHYGDVAAVDGVSLDIRPGQFVTLLGASGSGKTTLLRIIAGFLDATAGQIIVDDREISRVPVHKRHVGMVFQSYALFPHLNVEKNVVFPLARQGVPRQQRRALVAEALAAVHLTGFEKRLPKQLSGGQQQRVALARAIVGRPRLLLMDEPLGALDRRLRETLQIEIRRLSRDLGLTVINVTHDQEEALTMSDRIALLEHGKLVQYGTPEHLYLEPANETAARFIGESNIMEGAVVQADGQQLLDVPAGRIVLPEPRGGQAHPARSQVVVRPSAVSIHPASAVAGEAAGHCAMPGVVAANIFAGDSRKVVVDGAHGGELIVRMDAAQPFAHGIGDSVVLTWAATSSLVVAATAAADSGPAVTEGAAHGAQ
jgi:putative spermidine/putrescine transport system ATP-binding protein